MTSPEFDRGSRAGSERASPQTIKTREDLVVHLRAEVAKKGPIDGALTRAQLRELLKLVQLPPEIRVTERLDKIEKAMGKEHSLPRWLGGRVRRVLETSRKRGEKPRTSGYWEGIALRLLSRLPLAAETPPEYYPEPAPRDEILTQKQLTDALVYIELSDPDKPDSDSVAARLMDPVALSVDGLLVIPQPNKADEALKYDFTVPSSLLEILYRLKYSESEGVFKTWMLTQMETDVQAGIHFLKVLANFTWFLDSLTHLGMWQPPKVADRDPEVLLQPFNSLLKSVEYVLEKLPKNNSRAVREEVERTRDLIRLRYGEVYRGAHQTSLFTAGAEEALTPSPDDFAEFAASTLVENGTATHSPAMVATALVRLAESLGITNLEPLLARLGEQPEVIQALVVEARRAGLLPYPDALMEALNALEQNPWMDAAEIDYATLINRETTDLEFWVFTGTLGPWTWGHKDLLVGLQRYLDSQPSEEEGRVHQRLILIVPVPDVFGTPNYPKNPAHFGPLEKRVSAMLLQLSGAEIDRQKVLITTQLQPDPSTARTLEARVQDISHGLSSRILEDLRKVGRAAGIKLKIMFAFGPDEIEWHGDPRKIAPRTSQPQKVKEPSMVVVRRGWLLAVLRNHLAILNETGIRAVLLTPGTPYSSSSEVIKEIRHTGHTRAVAPAALAYVRQHWSPEAIRRREREPQVQAVRIPSVGEICQDLIKSQRAA